MPFSPSPSSVVVAPANPTAITSAGGLMAGLGAAAAAFIITPQVTGRILVLVTGDIVESATAQTGTLQLRSGTGTAPANAAALAGTTVGGAVSFTSLTGVLTVPFSLIAIITGLAVPSINSLGVTGAAVPVWLDLGCTSSAGSIQPTNLTCTAIEL